MKNYIITVDGEPAAGKGTLAKSIAKELHISYMDTGAMFRAVAFYFLKHSLGITDETIQNEMPNIEIVLKDEKEMQIVWLNGEDITHAIRTTEVSMAAKTVSKYKIVRERLVLLQREMAKNTSFVVDGQDMGTTVFPQARVKLFLVASLEERAKRRMQDFIKKGETVSFEQVKENLKERTEDDYTRLESPLRKPVDAILVDNTNMAKDETITSVMNVIKKRVAKS